MPWASSATQETVGFLQKTIELSKTAHAYLFVGPATAGTMALAKEFSQALFCQSEDAPCHECRHCTNIEKNLHPDLLIIEPGSTGFIGIDRIRRLIGDVSNEQIKELEKRDEDIPPRYYAMTSPLEADKKIIIIHGVEAMLGDTRDILLKILEEPPSKVTFILTTEDESVLNGTLGSRCQILRVKPIAFDQVESSLIKNGVDQELASHLSAITGGHIQKALDYAENPSLLNNMYSDYMFMPNMLFIPIFERIKLAEETAQNYRGAKALVLASMDTWMLFWRDAIISSNEVNIDAPMTVKNELMTRDELKKMGIPVVEATSAIRAIQQAQLALQSNGNARLIIEDLYMNLPLRIQ